jgi:hypothetical protein
LASSSVRTIRRLPYCAAQCNAVYPPSLCTAGLG